MRFAIGARWCSKTKLENSQNKTSLVSNERQGIEVRTFLNYELISARHGNQSLPSELKRAAYQAGFAVATPILRNISKINK